MSNKRIFYACQSVAVGGTELRGVQAVGINTTFNLEQVFEIGMLNIYQNVENLPTVEITIEKVLDGHPLVYSRATAGAATRKLIDCANAVCTVSLAIVDDTREAATGTVTAKCQITGAVVTQVSYKISVEGNATEQVTLLANNKTWGQGHSPAMSPTGVPNPTVIRRQDLGSCTFPTNIPGGAKYQSITTTANIQREDILELGEKRPFFKYAKFPIEVTTEFEIIAQTGDLVNVYDNQNNTTDQTIVLDLGGGAAIDLGVKNRLQSVNYQGGGTDGGNATIVYSYRTFNDFTVGS